MNIVFFSHTGNMGGAERSLLDLLSSVRKSHHVHVIIPHKGPFEKSLDKINIPHSIINYSWWASSDNTQPNNYSESFGNIVKSMTEIQSLAPDIIITNTAVIPWGAIVAKLLNIPHIWNVREFVQKDHQLIPEISFKGLAQFIYEFSDEIFFVSDSVKQEFEKYIPKDKSHVIYSNIKIDPKLANLPIISPFKNKNSFKVTIAASIAPNKDQETAIKAINYLINKNFNVELLIIGAQNKESQYFKEISLLIHQNNSHKIHLRKYRQNPYPYFKLSDAILVCSKSEALSRTIIEAGLLKTPVVVSNRGGNIEIITHQQNGLVYEYGNYQDLAKQIIYYIENKATKNRIIQNNFLNITTKFSKSKIYESTIRKIISQTKLKKPIVHLASFYQKIFIDTSAIIKENNLLKQENQIIKQSFLFKLWPTYNHFKKLFIK